MADPDKPVPFDPMAIKPAQPIRSSQPADEKKAEKTGLERLDQKKTPRGIAKAA